MLKLGIKQTKGLIAGMIPPALLPCMNFKLFDTVSHSSVSLTS